MRPLGTTQGLTVEWRGPYVRRPSVQKLFSSETAVDHSGGMPAPVGPCNPKALSELTGVASTSVCEGGKGGITQGTKRLLGGLLKASVRLSSGQAYIIANRRWLMCRGSTLLAPCPVLSRSLLIARGNPRFRPCAAASDVDGRIFGKPAPSPPSAPLMVSAALTCPLMLKPIDLRRSLPQEPAPISPRGKGT